MYRFPLAASCVLSFNHFSKLLFPNVTSPFKSLYANSFPFIICSVLFIDFSLCLREYGLVSYKKIFNPLCLSLHQAILRSKVIQATPLKPGKSYQKVHTQKSRNNPKDMDFNIIIDGDRSALYDSIRIGRTQLRHPLQLVYMAFESISTLGAERCFLHSSQQIRNTKCFGRKFVDDIVMHYNSSSSRVINRDCF